MKKFLTLCLCLLLASGAIRPVSAADTFIKDNTLNVSPVTEEQAQLLTAVMLDSFEDEEPSASKRTADDGTLSELYGIGPLEGYSCMRLTGNSAAGMTVTITKKRNTANTRSVAVCVFVEEAGDAVFTAAMTVTGSGYTYAGESDIPAGVWCAVFLPITGEAINLDQIHLEIRSSGPSRVDCRVDRLHTSTVCGLPEDLPYFASSFSTHKGEITYENDALVFTPSGSDSYIESSECFYMTGGVYNALTVELDNGSSAAAAVMRLRIDGARSYTQENSHSLALCSGKNVLKFPIGGFRSGTTVDYFRLEFPGSADGSIKIRSIRFSSFRFPKEYGGEVSAIVSGDKITVSGTMRDYPASCDKICLYRLAPGVDEELPAAVDLEPYMEAKPSGSFSFEVPLTDGNENNAYYKFLVRYESKNTYEDAGIAYPASKPAPLPYAAYKGLSVAGPASAVSSLMPAAVYLDVDVGALFSGEGEDSYLSGGKRIYLSDDALGRYDEVVGRCRAEDVPVILRLVYSPFADGDKYWFLGDTTAVPNLTSYDTASHFLSLLSFLADRYRGKINAVVPCTALNPEELASLRGLTPDEAEKYAASLILSCRNVLAGYDTAVMIPVCSEGCGAFLEMLGQDIDAASSTVFCECDGPADACNAAARRCGFNMIVYAPVNSAAELARLYYGCEKDAYGICVPAPAQNGDAASLFAVIDTTYGVTAAAELAKDEFPDGIAAEYPDVKAAKKVYADRGGIGIAELPAALAPVQDASSADGWQGYDCCKVYAEEIGGEPAAGFAFDFTGGDGGYAAYVPEVKRTYERLYFRLYTDYLPENFESAGIKITVYGAKGVIKGVCTAIPGEVCYAAVDTGDQTGRITRITVCFDDTSALVTPRICVLGVYEDDMTSTETAKETEPETLPPPESQHFDTAAETEAENKRTDVRLYITAIFVILGMFALCGAVIAFLKVKEQRSAPKKEENEDNSDDNKE